MATRRTIKRRRARRSRKQRGGKFVLTAEDIRRRTMEIAVITTLLNRTMESQNPLEKKQIVNEIAKQTLRLQILPFYKQWRDVILAKFQDFLRDGMDNDPEYVENLTAAITYLERF